MAATVTQEQERELIEAGFHPNTVARAQYEHYRTDGKMDHRTALRHAIDGLNGLKSDSMTPEEVAALKVFLKRVPGQFF